jgi:hypothetical protein
MATRGADNRYTFAHTHTPAARAAACRPPTPVPAVLTDLHPVESLARTLLRMALAV